MNVPLLTRTEVVEQPAVAPEANIGHQPANATLYIDADNQSCQCAKSLANLLRNELGLQVTRIVLAGNNHGKEIENWRGALAAELPDIEPLILHVSSRKQAADAALIMELGAKLERHLQYRERIIVVSRDDFLVGAAEHAKTRGCLVLVAYAHGEIPAARSSRLTTLVLPAVSKPSCLLPTADQGVTAPLAPTQTADVVRTVIAELRKLCTKQPGGGYKANEVGQALFKLGFDTKAKRARFLKTIPGLHEQGSGPDKGLVF
ncbi:PIN domain-containing protein [Methylotetracoccus oryzae]|uniref:NYN domain-containing protein n=1 Tax=Methylotetracoccus oryzae TaxID=1919059 RepID=UPI001118063A|nr:NYN domain-containing protein [Methylotetracoccus oryzae]